MMQIQFTEAKYEMTVGNVTLHIPGKLVSHSLKKIVVINYKKVSVPNFSYLWLQVVKSMGLDSQPLYVSYLILGGNIIVFLLLYYLSLRFIKQKSNQDW